MADKLGPVWERPFNSLSKSEKAEFTREAKRQLRLLKDRYGWSFVRRMAAIVILEDRQRQKEQEEEERLHPSPEAKKNLKGGW